MRQGILWQFSFQSKRLIRADGSLQDNTRVVNRRFHRFRIGGFTCKALMKQIRVRSPDFERGLHRRGGDRKIEKAYRGLVNLELSRHGSIAGRAGVAKSVNDLINSSHTLLLVLSGKLAVLGEVLGVINGVMTVPEAHIAMVRASGDSVGLK